MTTSRDATAPVCLNAGRMGFNGELFESATGHYLLGNGYRAYSPLLMIFLQPDSWSPFGAGGLNAYAYCAGDPVNAADPTGHMPFPTSRPWNYRWIKPPPSPDRSRPGSPFTPNMQDFPLLDNFSEQPVMNPAAVGGSSPTGLAPVPDSLLPPTSPSRQLYSSSSGAPIPAGRAGPSGGFCRFNRCNVDYLRIERKIRRMIPFKDAEGIISLSEESFSRSPVLRELHRQLLRQPGETSPVYARRGQAPEIKQRDFVVLEYHAKNEGLIEDAQFYARLRHGFAEQNVKRFRKYR